MEEAGWEQQTGIVAESYQWWHRSNLTLCSSSAAAFWPEEVILQWNICLIPEHWLDAPSNFLSAPYPQSWSHHLSPWPASIPPLGGYLLPPFYAPSPLLSCLFIPVYPKSLLQTPLYSCPSSGSKSPSLRFFFLPLTAYPSLKMKTDCRSQLGTLVLLIRKSQRRASLVPALQPQGREWLPSVVSLENLSDKFRWFSSQISHNVPCQVSRPYKDFSSLS